jgi:hypothetical protein
VRRAWGVIAPRAGSCLEAWCEALEVGGVCDERNDQLDGAKDPLLGMKAPLVAGFLDEAAHVSGSGVGGRVRGRLEVGFGWAKECGLGGTGDML